MTKEENLINAAIQVIPKSDKKPIYDIVDEAIAVIQQSGLKHAVTPMETVIEGPHTKVLDVLNQAQLAALKAGADEILVNIKLHIRKKGDVTFDEKIGKYS